jgi:hypothetical protein
VVTVPRLTTLRHSAEVAVFEPGQERWPQGDRDQSGVGVEQVFASWSSTSRRRGGRLPSGLLRRGSALGPLRQGLVSSTEETAGDSMVECSPRWGTTSRKRLRLLTSGRTVSRRTSMADPVSADPLAAARTEPAEQACESHEIRPLSAELMARAGHTRVGGSGVASGQAGDLRRTHVLVHCGGCGRGAAGRSDLVDKGASAQRCGFGQGPAKPRH